ncbi:MAG TPA: TonB-dependent receptor [Bacteroidia bacterium]|nr:TonB-dependent receptor [Bacteroidia bacterium]
MKSFKKIAVIYLVNLAFSIPTFAQTITQTIRGNVVDKISQSPLPGVIITLLNSSPIKGCSTDSEGNFKLNEVAIGKQSLRVSFLGYKELVLQNLVVNSGKELVITVQLEEESKAIQEFVVSEKVEKNKALNPMSTVSTRTFSVEETQKFAAAVNDPARMATSFAGVTQGPDGNNHISIRGNSPNGLLWRMEGVEIPNPNHFSSVGTSGGGISILSAQLLGNSDFSTGAFAAEYGNALSGVFDLKLRKGNNEKREYTFQLGLLGVDAASEGPIKAGYEGSYLVNYRYSTLNLLSKIGVPIDDGSTNFQDLSFNVSLPTKKVGNFSVFGFGGLSYQRTNAKKDTAKWSEDSFTQYNSNFYSNTGAVGITHTKLYNNQSYLKTILAFSGSQNASKYDKLQEDFVNLTTEQEEKYFQNKITLSSSYTKKISAKSNVRTGIIANQLGYNLELKDKKDTSELITRIHVKGATQTFQAFFQWNYKLSNQLTTNLGLHYNQLLLNNSNSIEPRASLKYDVNANQNITLGYGLHSQLQPIGVYFAQSQSEDGRILTPNKNLALSKAHHIVMGYDVNINSFSHIKAEIYYQHLFSLPISKDTSSTYSIVNSTDGYTADELVNNGLGKNYGLELTYERFLHKNLYYLLSASLYDSKYKAADGVWYDTRFNTNYTFSFTGGKEWTLSEKRKSRVIGFNLKALYVGGFRYTPIDLNASVSKGETVVDDNQTFKEKNPDYYRLDIRVSVKRNYKKLTSTVALDIQNTTNRRNVGGQYFNSKTGEINYWYQTPLIPILSYRLEF